MSNVVYDIGLGNDPVTYDVVLKKDLMWVLEENFRTCGHLPQAEFDRQYDAPVTVDRDWLGWPWLVVVEHPLLGRIGCADEEDVGSVAALMKYVRDHWGDRQKLAPGTPWPEPWPTNEQTTSIPLD